MMNCQRNLIRYQPHTCRACAWGTSTVSLYLIGCFRLHAWEHLVVVGYIQALVRVFAANIRASLEMIWSTKAVWVFGSFLFPCKVKTCTGKTTLTRTELRTQTYNSKQLQSRNAPKRGGRLYPWRHQLTLPSSPGFSFFGAAARV